MSRKRVKAKLRTYPDPILTQVCEPVKDGEDVSDIIRDMMYILTNSKTGVGLAAPQAGHPVQVIIVQRHGRHKVMINPRFIPMDQAQPEDKVTEDESCLSHPGISKPIPRYERITVEYRDEDGIHYEGNYVGFEARIIQHEIDHLNGKCRVGE